MEEWIGQMCLALFGALFTVEIIPIKFSPLRWIGKRINSDIKDELNELTETIDKNEMDRIRYEVLAFANSCKNKRIHTNDEFQHIVDLNDKYEKLIEKHGVENGVFKTEYAYILDVYKRCLDKDAFLMKKINKEEK